MQEFLVEEREDANAKSIEQSLRSPKKIPKDSKDSNPNPKVAGAPAVKAVPPKASPPGGDKERKGKGKSKTPLTAEEKAKTPCIFFQMPSGCVHGNNCQYSRAKTGVPKSLGYYAFGSTPHPVIVDIESIQSFEGANINLYFLLLQGGGYTQITHANAKKALSIS